jgi:hypothetical protein
MIACRCSAGVCAGVGVRASSTGGRGGCGSTVAILEALLGGGANSIRLIVDVLLLVDGALEGCKKKV